MNTLPFFICQANFGQCIASHPNDADGQQMCKDNAKCGTLNATALNAASSSSSTSQPTSQAASSTSKAAATTTGTQAAATSSNAAMAIQMAQEYSAGILATVFLAVFKFLL
jgi:hypothetical protein